MSKKENVLLGRTEVRFRLSHANEPTPRRDAVREKLASTLAVNKGTIVIDNMDTDFGRAATAGLARIYPNPEAAKKQERWYLLKRNAFEGIGEKRKKAAAPAQAPAKKGGK